MGKGSEQRSRDDKYCTAEEFRERWDKIFAKKEEKEPPKKEDECPGNG